MSGRTCLRFAAHGVGLEVASDRSTLLDAALPYLPPLRTPLGERQVARSFFLRSNGPEDESCTLFDGERLVGSSPRLRGTLKTLEWEVHRFLAEHAPDRIFVHAGVVEWRGKAIVVPGRSFSGKSTLVATLISHGCAYLSDEYAILDSNGLCHAHPRPLGLRVDGRVERRDVAELGGRTGSAVVPVGCVVVTRYSPDARWQPETLSRGSAVLALLHNTVAIRSRSSEALAALRASVAGADAYGGVRGGAAEMAEALLARLGASGTC